MQFIKLLPTQFINAIICNIRDLLGVLFTVTSILLSVSCYYYHVDDVSFNTASGATPHNILGIGGSYSADLLRQLFGNYWYILVLIFGILGIRLLFRSKIKITFGRLVAIFFGQLTFCIFVGGFKFNAGVIANLFITNYYKFLSHYQILYLFKISLLLCLLSSIIMIGWGIGFNLNTIKRCYNFIKMLILALNKKIPLQRSDLLNLDPINIQNTSKNNSTNIPINNLVEDAIKIEHNKNFSLTDYDDQSEYWDGEYTLPKIDLFDQINDKNTQKNSEENYTELAKALESVLEEFGIKGEIVNIRPGPVVTMYELKPAPGIKTSRVIGLADDIARSMSALSARIAVIPGQNVIGIELPNKYRQTVFMRHLLIREEYLQTQAALPIILGQDISGNAVIADLAKMPHLLVAGTTGSGKSVSVNAMIISLLFKFTPEQCKLIMIDPKMLELSIYDDIPHLLTPVVTDPKKAIVALKWAVKEMENRYKIMAKLGVRNIDGYNSKLLALKEKGEILSRRVQTGFDPDSGQPVFEDQPMNLETFPYIVVIVDEMADLMLVAGKDIEAAVQRLAQMARAAGIHLIMATQRPSVDVITGTIKANFPTRISFQVTSKIDSRTILGEQGAEQLLGQGDMLYMVGGGKIIRVHGPFVKDIEIERVVKFLKKQGEPVYVENVTIDDEESANDADNVKEKSNGDVLYQQALELIRRERKVSTSFIQRHLQIGYNRAARIVEQLEKENLITPPNHVGKREVIF